jgi:aerobic C4-dicarboxylate transport protein
MRRFFGKLYVQVLIGVFAGVALGFFAPGLGSDLKPLGDIFIKLIKMVFAPIIFATVVLGIARMENMKELGRVGVRALDLLRGPVDLCAGARPRSSSTSFGRARA